MRKILMLSLGIMLFATGCSGGTKEADAPKEERKEASETIEVTKENGDEHQFDGEVVEIEDVKIKILETEIIQPGEEGGGYTEEPLWVVRYEVTNKSDKELDASDAWFAIFEVVQDNSDDVVNELELGILSDGMGSDDQHNTIKQGGTAKGDMAYTLSDLTTPVTLIANKGYDGGEIGRADYDIE